jgi:hypothetical protein
MEYYQEKFNSGRKLNSTANFSLEITKTSIIYHGTFHMEFKKNEVPDGVTFKHELFINKTNGEFIVSYEIINKRSTKGRLRSSSWVKKTDFDKLYNLTHMGFYRGEKRRGFWGVKFERKATEFFELIRLDLQSEMEWEYLKKKSYYKPVINRLFDLIVDYHLYKREIKGHDNVYQDIQLVYPKKKWLKLNDNKFLPAILDENGIKSKYLIKELSQKENPTHIANGTVVNIRGVIYLCNLFGENHLDYIKKFEWKEIARTSFNKSKKHGCKTEGEKQALVDIFNKHIKMGGDGQINALRNPPRVRKILLSLHKLIEVRDLLEERGYVLKLKLKTPDDIELLLPYWMVIKKGALSGFVIKHNIPQEVIDDIQRPIIVSDKLFQARVLLTDAEFSLEGLEMKNCMGKQFTNASIFIFISFSHEKTKINLQYQKGVLNQSYGKANTPVPMSVFGEALTELNKRMSKYDTLKWDKEKIPIPPRPF